LNDKKRPSDSKPNSQSEQLLNAPHEERPEIIELEPIERIQDLGPLESISIRREKAAFFIALIIVLLFAVSILFSFLYLFIFKGECKDAFELFKTVSAVLSGPLGFVLGYYFRITPSES
jgi:hypothetical protein